MLLKKLCFVFFEGRERNLKGKKGGEVKNVFLIGLNQ